MSAVFSLLFLLCMFYFVFVCLYCVCLSHRSFLPLRCVAAAFLSDLFPTYCSLDFALFPFAACCFVYVLFSDAIVFFCTFSQPTLTGHAGRPAGLHHAGRVGGGRQGPAQRQRGGDDRGPHAAAPQLQHRLALALCATVLGECMCVLCCVCVH